MLAHLLQSLGWCSILLLPLYLDTLGANRTQVGAVTACASVGGILFHPAVGRALDRLGRKPTFIFGSFVLASGAAAWPTGRTTRACGPWSLA